MASYRPIYLNSHIQVSFPNDRKHGLIRGNILAYPNMKDMDWGIGICISILFLKLEFSSALLSIQFSTIRLSCTHFILLKWRKRNRYFGEVPDIWKTKKRVTYHNSDYKDHENANHIWMVKSLCSMKLINKFWMFCSGNSYIMILGVPIPKS